MKKFKLNPAAKNVELRTKVNMQNLETMGWDFDDSHESVSKAQGIDIESARQYNYNNYQIVVELESYEKGIATYCSFHNYNTNEISGKEETGDDDQTIKDIISMLEEGTLAISNDEDYSTDEEGNYVPTFIEE